MSATTSERWLGASAIHLGLVVALAVLLPTARGDTTKLPAPLRDAGFKDTLEEALVVARREDRLVLLYLVPSWSDCRACSELESNVLASREFREHASAFVPVRVAVEPESDLLARTWIDRFPSLRVLGKDGFVVASPRGHTVAAIVSAVEDGKRREQELARYFASADVSKSEVRADVIQKHVERGDFASARSLYKGFGEADASDARLRAALAVSDSLLRTRQFDELRGFVDDAEKRFHAKEARARLDEIRASSLLLQIELAAARKDRERALSLLDEFVAKYPNHPAAKNAEGSRRTIRDLK